jgi:hypothetical protein
VALYNPMEDGNSRNFSMAMVTQVVIEDGRTFIGSYTIIFDDEIENSSLNLVKRT